MGARMFRKGLAVAVILLFIGVAFAPSINASVVDDELVEFDVEFSGLGKKHRVQLTQEEADDVENIFEELKQKMKTVKSSEGTAELFNEAVVELDKYGLLGSFSVKQVQRLIVGGKLRQELIDRLDKRYNDIFNDDAAYLCFVAGTLTNVCYFNFYTLPVHILLDLSHNNVFTIGFILALFRLIIAIPSLLIATLLPFCLFSTVCAGYEEYYNNPYGHSNWISSSGWLLFGGIIGTGEWIGESMDGDASDFNILILRRECFPAIIGFTGVKFKNINNGRSLFLGRGLKVKMDVH